MNSILEYKKIFDKYGGMMRTKQLQAANIHKSLAAVMIMR